MESIVSLEALLNEFYHHSTSNFRKKQIEVELKTFQDSNQSHTILLQHLSICMSNQFLFFFSVSTLELTITTKKWIELDLKTRIQIREGLWYIYSSFPTTVGAMQRDKMAQLIALLGKREFPDEHSEFFNQIMSLIKMKFLLGITLLKAVSHEICSTKIDTTYHQRNKFLQSMTLCLSDIICMLGKFLTLCVCYINNNELVVGPDIDFDMHNSLPNDERFIFCCTELLNTIGSLFTWIPPNIDSIMSVEFFNNIYELCSYTSEKYINIHLTALTTICELFYIQKQLPQVQVQANGITELLQQKNLMISNEEYQDKFCELLKLFIQQQWGKFVNQPEFPAKEFLLHLFRFTFYENVAALTFSERLSLWISIIKSFNEKIAPRYTETVCHLISNVIIKMQFSTNSEFLDLLDTEELDENMETELQSYRNNCIEVILTAAEIEPCKIFDLLNLEFTKETGNLKHFVTILNDLPDYTKDVTSKSRMNLNQIVRFSADPTFYLHCMCRDLTTLLQTITQTSNVILTFTCERSNSITNVIRTCILTLKLANQKKLHLYDLDPQLKSDLIELQAQILLSVRSLMLLRTEIYDNHNEIFQLIDSVMQIILPSHFGFIEPSLVINAAAQLMITITGTLRPNYFLKNTLVQELLHSDLSRYDPQIRLQIKMIVFNALILNYSNIAVNLTEEQEYEKRGEICQQYVAFISYKFLSANITTNHVTVREEIRAELKDYEHILNTYEDTNNFSKQILLGAINPIIKKSIEIFQFTAKSSYQYDENDLTAIIDFNLSIVKCLQMQLGSDFVINIVRLFLEVASTPNRSTHALNKLLEMLIYIVQHTGATSTQLLPDILKLTLDDLLRANVDISFNLFSLYDSILQNHWNYFQKNIPNNMRNNQEDLMKILTTYGHFLCNTPIDANVGRVILNSLEKLHEKWRLYDKAFFNNSLLRSFLCTLLRLIISPEGILFYDQIISIIFYMSEQNKVVLQECFASVLTDKEKIVQICQVTDVCTFSRLMEIIIQDIHVVSQQHH
ncbi:hypothetical protein PVAND_012725 [Polypedilum vanderplanki]|uniref:Exportin-1/Importin-beta-like domain-containing protein n=1 Tax=Polypedilum vanderplanki TaxID=319348 RepID=A0A9J6CPB7_POLVA|nr:hypothetical protein PVAND_012725 [Polypedilum vanderplanki]